MRKFAANHQLVTFYGITFLISWTAWWFMSLVYDGAQTTIIVYVFSTIGGLGPLLSLAMLQRITHQEISLKEILSQIRFKDWKNLWIAAAIVTIPILSNLGNLIRYLTGGEGRLQIIKSRPDELGIFVVLVMMIHFAASLITSPLFEEPGWRGFALPRLQDKFGRTLGSLVVAVLWWLWHQPMNLTFGLEPTLHSALSMIVLSLIIDSLFNLSGGNLLAAMLAHQSYGTVFTFIYEGEPNWITLGLRVLFLVVIRSIEYRRTRKSPVAIPV